MVRHLRSLAPSKSSRLPPSSAWTSRRRESACPKPLLSRGRKSVHHHRCDPAGLLQSPKTPEPRKYEKNTKSPTPGWPPKIRKKYRKNTKTAQKLPFRGHFVFFRYFFRIFGAQPGVGDFVFFSYFRGSGVFGLCSRPAGSQHHRGTPPFSVCRPTPRSQSKKSYGVYHFLGKQGERVDTIGPERRVCTIEASDPKKRRISTVVVSAFSFPDFCRILVIFRQEKRAQRLSFFGSGDRPVGWGSSTRRGGGRKLRARPRNFVFLGFRREESGMSREFCRDVPGPLAVFKKFVQKNFVRIFRSLDLAASTRKSLAITIVRFWCTRFCLSGVEESWITSKARGLQSHAASTLEVWNVRQAR